MKPKSQWSQWRAVGLAASCLAAVVLPASPARAQAKSCTPTTSVESQPRTALKHRAATGSPSPKPVTVTQMLAWEPPAGVADEKVRRAETPIDDKEKQAWVLEADVQLARIEGNDCDVHLELSESGAGKAAPRIIVEIPTDTGCASARKDMLGALKLPLGEKPQAPSPPVHVKVTGWGFWDGAHWTQANPKVGHAHGSAQVGNLWELHPVVQLEVVGSATAAPEKP